MCDGPAIQERNVERDSMVYRHRPTRVLRQHQPCHPHGKAEEEHGGYAISAPHPRHAGSGRCRRWAVPQDPEWDTPRRHRVPHACHYLPPGIRRVHGTKAAGIRPGQNAYNNEGMETSNRPTPPCTTTRSTASRRPSPSYTSHAGPAEADNPGIGPLAQTYPRRRPAPPWGQKTILPQVQGVVAMCEDFCAGRVQASVVPATSALRQPLAKLAEGGAHGGCD